MENIKPTTPLWQLTIEQFLKLQRKFNSERFYELYEFGLKGIARIFGCSETKAKEIKRSGIIKDAIYQQKKGGLIVIDRNKALALYTERRNKVIPWII